MELRGKNPGHRWGMHYLLISCESNDKPSPVIRRPNSAILRDRQTNRRPLRPLTLHKSPTGCKHDRVGGRARAKWTRLGTVYGK